MDQRIKPSKETDIIILKTGLTPEMVSDTGVVFDYINQGKDPIQRGKETLFITLNQGALIKACPGTSQYTCCDYTILFTGTFCTMDCSYCILQAYFHPPLLQYFAGREELSNELDSLFMQDKLYRIGTGEFTDSLIWERLSDQPAFLVNKFSGQSNAVLELKTKTVNIESLKSINHNRKTIIAWSVNTPEVIRSEERNTASLGARLAAANQMDSLGYPLAFHFDPLVIYPGCEKEYQQVIDKIFTAVTKKNIVWISIGSFRFMPALKPIIEKRFPASTLCYGEFITGLDNKMRYFKPLRIELYRKVISHIKAIAPDVFVYFCMEDKEVWEKCLGFFPEGEGELGRLLDESAVTHCRLDTGLL